MNFRQLRFASVAIVLVTLIGASVGASNANAAPGGLLGFYVFETPRGLIINNFIEGTSAHELFLQGSIAHGDRLIRLNGRPLRSVRDVFAVTDHLLPGVDYGVLDVVTRAGRHYRLYITPSANGGAAACMLDEPGSNGNGGVAPPAPGPRPVQHRRYRQSVRPSDF